jgi:hypothetical protein
MKLGAWAKHATLALQPGEKRQSSAPKLPPRLSRLAGTPHRPIKVISREDLPDD